MVKKNGNFLIVIFRHEILNRVRSCLPFSANFHRRTPIIYLNPHNQQCNADKLVAVRTKTESQQKTLILNVAYLNTK